MSELKKISPEFLVKAKGVLRITTNDTVINSEIETLIRACQRDLIRNGITPSLVYDLEDSLIEMAVLTYLKAEFGLDNKNYDKVLKHCTKCKYFDDETDFPNCFCYKSCEGIDYHFCTLKCPLGKFEIVGE